MRSLCPSYLLCSFRQRWMSSSSLGGTQCCWRARRGERPFASSCLMTPALTRRFAWTGWSATTSGCVLVMSSGKTVFCLNFHNISWLIDRSWECCFSNLSYSNRHNRYFKMYFWICGSFICSSFWFSVFSHVRMWSMESAFTFCPSMTQWRASLATCLRSILSLTSWRLTDQSVKVNIPLKMIWN